jgi:hypothetical protein
MAAAFSTEVPPNFMTTMELLPLDLIGFIDSGLERAQLPAAPEGFGLRLSARLEAASFQCSPTYYQSDAGWPC